MLSEGGYYLFIQLIINKFPRDRIVCFTGNYVPRNNIDSLCNDLQIVSNRDEKNKLLDEINVLSGGEIGKEIAEHLEEQGIAPEKHEIISIIRKYSKTLDVPTTASQLGENGPTNFQDRFKEARIPTPTIISKGAENKKLPEYLKPFSVDPYILLRRAIFNACEFLTEKLNDTASDIKINKALDKNYFNHDQTFFLLLKLKTFLPICEPHDDNDHFLSDLIRFVNHDWDKINWDDIRGKKPTIETVFMQILKSVRNRSAHGSIFNSAHVDQVAFILLINMRVLFSLPDKTLPYEEEFLKLISKPTEENRLDHKSLVYKLSDRYLNIRNTFYRPWSLKIDEIYDIKNNNKLSDKKIKYLLDSFYDYFWYLTSIPETTPLIKDKNHGLSLTISFKKFDYTTHPYLLEFSKHLYTKTFEKNETS